MAGVAIAVLMASFALTAHVAWDYRHSKAVAAKSQPAPGGFTHTDGLAAVRAASGVGGGERHTSVVNGVPAAPQRVERPPQIERVVNQGPRVCADTAFTESRGRAKKQWKRCICPAAYDCVGCDDTCKVQPRPHYKPRCAYGYLSTCANCSCSDPTAGQSSSHGTLGVMQDRRSEPFCVGASTAEQAYTGNYTFVFVVSNGHTGTTFIGQTGVWRTYLGKGKFIPPGYAIAHENEPDKGELVQIPFFKDYCARAVKYVVGKKIPKISSVLRNRKQHTYIASGHQIVLGIIPALADVLGARGRFVRMRRNRLDVAYSYAQKLDGPCALGCKYCICPMDPLARCPVSAAVWEQLSVYQQFLWFVDELECQWHAVLKDRPNLIVTDLNWDHKIGPEHLMQVSVFATAIAELTRARTHARTHTPVSYTDSHIYASAHTRST